MCCLQRSVPEFDLALRRALLSGLLWPVCTCMYVCFMPAGFIKTNLMRSNTTVGLRGEDSPYSQFSTVSHFSEGEAGLWLVAQQTTSVWHPCAQDACVPPAVRCAFDCDSPSQVFVHQTL